MLMARLIGIALLFLWTGQSQGQQPAQKFTTEGEKNVANTPLTSDSKDLTAESVGYRIGPQDVLRVDVWREEEISRQVTVRPDGKISLPLLNDVQASGLMAMELSQAIREQLKNYITDPQVTVTVVEINSRRIFVTGEVQHPGAFTLLPNMTVLQALSSCGGFTLFANTKKIYILRTENGKQKRIPVNYKSLISGRKGEEDIKLQGGDTIVIP